MVWQRLTRRWKNETPRDQRKKKRSRRLSMESLAKRELLASDFGSITGTAFNDANNNNVFDAGDIGLANVNISIAGPINATVQTNAQGEYRFDNLTEGTYTVTQDPPAPAGFTPDAAASPQTVVLSAADVDGENVLAIDGFDGLNQSIEASANVGGTNPNQSSLADGTVIGGTRDIFVNVTSAAGVARASSNDPTPGILEIDPSGNGAAVYTITYDSDNDATTLDPNGLNADLTQAGTGTAVQVLLGFDVAAGSAGVETFQMVFFTGAGNSTTFSFNLPSTASAAATAEVLIRFDGTGELINGALTENAVVTTTGTGADFANVGAIQLIVDTDGETAVDGNVDTLRVIGPTVQTTNFANDQITPQIVIEKSTNGQDADTATGPLLGIGTTAAFEYVVTNPGTTALDITSITDDAGTPGNAADDFTPLFIGGDTNNNQLLDVTETWTYQSAAADNVTVTAGQYTNLASIVANPVDAAGNDLAGVADVADNDPSNHFGVDAQIDLQKLTNGVDADTATGPLLAVGSTATFTYNVTNPGNVDLGTVTVRDDNGTPGNTADDFDAVFDATSDTNANGRLDNGETFVFTATRVVTAGQYTNIAVATGNPVDAAGADIATLNDVTDTDPSNHFGVAPQIELQKLTNGVDADTATGPTLAVGSTATFTYNVTNPGNIGLGTVTVRDDNGTPANTTDDFDAVFDATSDTNANGQLDVGETFVFTATRVVTEGQYTNIAVANGNPVDAAGTDIPNIADVNDTDPSNHFGAAPQIDLQKLTNGVDADTATGPTLAVGTTATFTYNVTNPGNVPLGSVTVRDDNGTPGNTADDFDAVFDATSDTNANGFLDVGETFVFNASRTVTEGQYTNLGTVTGNPLDAAGNDIPNVADVTDTDPSNHIGIAAQIQLQKLTNGVDADTATGPTLAIGSTATFTYNVTNPGNVPLGSVTVVDDNGTPGNTADDFNATFDATSDTNANGRLDNGETFVFTASRIVTAGQYTNIAVASGNPLDVAGNDIPNIADVTDTDPSNHFGIAAQIDVQKLTNGVDADTATGPSLPVGSTATFTYNVTNPGTVPLGSVTVRDDNGTPGNTGDDFNATFVASSDTNNNGQLDNGETFQFTATRVVTLGQHTNIGTASGNPLDGAGNDIPSVADVTDTDPSNHIGVNSTINIEKATNGQDSDTSPGQRLEVGSTATFSYVVTNTGLAIANVVVTDDNGTPGVTTDDFAPTFNGGDTNANGLLDAGESWLYSATRIVTLGQYTNIATVTGDNPGGGAALTDADASNHIGVVDGTLSKRDFLASTVVV